MCTCTCKLLVSCLPNVWSVLLKFIFSFLNIRLLVVAVSGSNADLSVPHFGQQIHGIYQWDKFTDVESLVTRHAWTNKKPACLMDQPCGKDGPLCPASSDSHHIHRGPCDKCVKKKCPLGRWYKDVTEKTNMEMLVREWENVCWRDLCMSTKTIRLRTDISSRESKKRPKIADKWRWSQEQELIENNPTSSWKSTHTIRNQAEKYV